VHSIRAFPSRSELRSERHHAIGPLQLHVTAPAGRISDVVDLALGLFDVAWPFERTPWPVTVDVHVRSGRGEPAAGDYLATALLQVDSAAGALRATSLSGAVADGRLDRDGERWLVSLSQEATDRDQAVDIDAFLTLVLATGWRRAGWIPMHGAAVVHGDRGILICAQGGGGKTTFALAFVQRGWRAIGDDKVLLGAIDGSPMMAAVQQILHVDPASSGWLPELEGKTWHPAAVPTGVKRRIRLGSIWPQAGAYTGAPTDVVVLERPVGARGFEVHPIDHAGVLDALIRQTAMPRDPGTARATLATLVTTASRCQGWRIAVGHAAYADSTAVDELVGTFS
jgi:hypothetical protein